MESTNEKTLFEVSEIQLSYKSKVKASLRPKISSSRDAENILRQLSLPTRYHTIAPGIVLNALHSLIVRIHYIHYARYNFPRKIVG